MDSSENIVTFGIKPTYPETGFGYIEYDPIDGFVVKFIEKPNLEKASELIKSENIFWNSGIFLLESTNFLKTVYELNPKLLESIEKLISIKNYDSIQISSIQIDFKYSKLESVYIDYGIIRTKTNFYVRIYW